MENKEARRKIAHRNLCFCGTVALIAGFIIGILIGRFAACTEGEDAREGVFLKGVPKRIIQDGDPDISAEIIDQIKADNIREYLRKLTENPHVAGTPADWEQADELRNFWLDNGLDEVFINEYDVLLSRPNISNKAVMNRVQLVDGSDNVVYESPLFEETLHPSENRSGVLPPFNAYSAAGIVESNELIYVNYGRYEDYVYMENQSPPVNVSGKIVIARYGKIFRGDKVKLAAKYGAIGIILYSDPDDYADGQTNSSNVYPHDWWLPTFGVQRGSLVLAGDPLTPGYPSVETAYREKETDIYLPKIPCHPISSGTASEILTKMTGSIVSDEWKGAIPNVVYKQGGKLSNTSWKVKLKISTENYRAKTYNVIGLIKGSIEPDRYVLLGNHRDSWVFGAVDPSSATAVLKEVSRVMGQLVKSGKWRPRRSILFCSWGAEEYGLIGSYEWVEQYVKNLAERSVAYLNVDMAIEGNYSFKLKSTPLLYNTVFSATKKVPNPYQGDDYETVYDRWSHVVPAESNIPNSLPKVHAIGSGSDYAPMIQLVGLPSCGFRFTWNREKYKLSSYPLYHSKYETFNIVDTVMDKGFMHHRAVGQVWAEVAWDLSDTTIIPLDVGNFADEVIKLVNVLETEFGNLLRSKGINFDDLRKVSNSLKEEASVFTKMINNVNLNNPLAVRQVNDQLMLFERAFIDPQGLPSRPYARHILFADSSTNTYAGSSFPGLVDALFEIEQDPDQEKRWKVVKKHFSVILFTIDSATSTIRDVTKFIPEFEKSG